MLNVIQLIYSKSGIETQAVWIISSDHVDQIKEYHSPYTHGVISECANKDMDGLCLLARTVSVTMWWQWLWLNYVGPPFQEEEQPIKAESLFKICLKILPF